MKLYKLRRTDKWSWDEYDSAVVAAENEEDAKKMHPRGTEWNDEFSSGWVYILSDIEVIYLGEAVEGIEKGVILSSFNAG